MVVHSPKQRTTIVVLGNTSAGLDTFNTGQPPDPELFKMLANVKQIIREGR